MAPDERPTVISSRRSRIFASGLVWRVMLAVLIGFLIVMIFFATNAR